MLSRNKPIRRKGSRTLAWEAFRKVKLESDRDEEGLIKCQDYKVGLPRCGIAIPSPDLHHIEGRDGDLLLDESKMVWLVRACHETCHQR